MSLDDRPPLRDRFRSVLITLRCRIAVSDAVRAVISPPWIFGIAICVAIIVFAPIRGGAFAAPTAKFIDPDQNERTVVEAVAGGHKLKAEIFSVNEWYAANPKYKISDCANEDVMTVRVLRDGKPFYSQQYCSSHQFGWVDLKLDIHGVPYLLVGSAGSRYAMPARDIYVYWLGDTPKLMGAIVTSEQLSCGDYAEYEYRVTKPSSGGIVLHTRPSYLSPKDKDDCYVYSGPTDHWLFKGP